MSGARARPRAWRGRRLLGWLGRTRARWWREDIARPRWQAWLWTLALVAVSVWLALRIGVADWYTHYPLTLPDGTVVRLPNVYSAIDHPFHIAKERVTIDALEAGQLPRWIMATQGGFPVEFYPLGGDLIVAAVYFLGFGAIPVAIAHKLVVIGVLFLPPLAYWALARRDRLPLSVALLAGLLHLFARGTWLAGGSRELIDYGLWPDVFASYMPLFIILWGADWLRRGNRRGLLLTTLVATLAIYTNPRSILGIAAACLALGLVAASEHARLWPVLDRIRVRWRRGARVAHTGATPLIRALSRRGNPLVALVGRSALLTLLVGLLSAALLLPLRAHQDRYLFVHFIDFTSVADIWRLYNEAVLPQLVMLAGLGLVVGFVRRGFYGRVFALLLPLSYLIVALVGWQFRTLPLFAQLEGPRLLPLLRPATIFLAALGAHELLRLALRLVRLRGATVLTGLVTAGLAGFFLLSGYSPLDAEQRGLPWLQETTDQPAFTAIARSAYLFTQESTPADKPLVFGSSISWHSAFWITALTGRAVYYDDWLWFWRATDYDYRNALRDEPGALELPFLARHGLTMLLVDTNRQDLLALADTKPYLRQLDPGTAGGYALYRVVAPPGPENGWASLTTGVVRAVRVRAEGLTVEGQTTQAGFARVLINDYPRWRATVNGQPAPITPSGAGYMLVPVPAGDVTIELSYHTEPIGWLARGLVVLGAVLLIGIVCWPARCRRYAARKRRAPFG